ncbi:MAG: polysaccharide pyruvyl transferase family protein [Candidatus Hadarchaeum sp.]
MKILIINLHSALNLGDEAIMHSTLKALRQRYPTAEIIVAANDPMSWQKFEDILVVGSIGNWFADCRKGNFRSKLPLALFNLFLLILTGLLFRYFRIRFYFGSREQKFLLQAYYEADLILSCGGGNLYAYRSISPALIWHLVALIFPLILGKRVFMLPQSIGPISGKIQQKIVAMVLARVKLVAVREGQSYNYVKRILKSNSHLVLLPDLAFGLRPQQTLQERLMICRESNPQIGMTLMNLGVQMPGFDQKHYEEVMRNLILKLHSEIAAHIHIFVQSYGPSKIQDDRLTSERVYRSIKETAPIPIHFHNSQNVFEIINAYREMDCIIGTRMHSAIMAFNAYTPVILIGYQPKAIGVMESFGLDKYWVDIRSLDESLITNLVRDIMKEQAHIISQIATKYNSNYCLLKNWTNLLEIL